MITNGTLLFDRQGTDTDARFTGFPSEGRYRPRPLSQSPLTLPLPLASVLLTMLRNSSVPQSVYLYAGEFGPVYIAVVGSTSNLNNCRGYLSSRRALAGSAKYPFDKGGTTDIA